MEYFVIFWFLWQFPMNPTFKKPCETAFPSSAPRLIHRDKHQSKWWVSFSHQNRTPSAWPPLQATHTLGSLWGGSECPAARRQVGTLASPRAPWPPGTLVSAWASSCHHSTQWDRCMQVAFDLFNCLWSLVCEHYAINWFWDEGRIFTEATFK